MNNHEPLLLSDDDLKEVFSLFSSCTRFERDQVYDQNCRHYFRNENLSEEYSLTMAKRDFALDAWRAVITFLSIKGFTLKRAGNDVDLSSIQDAFL